MKDRHTRCALSSATANIIALVLLEYISGETVTNGGLGTISGKLWRTVGGTISGKSFDGTISGETAVVAAGARLAAAPAPSTLMENCADCEGVRHHHVILGAGKFCCPASPAWCRVPAPTREPYNYLRHTTTNTFNLCFSSCFVLRPLVQCLHLQV